MLNMVIGSGPVEPLTRPRSAGDIVSVVSIGEKLPDEMTGISESEHGKHESCHLLTDGVHNVGQSFKFKSAFTNMSNLIFINNILWR